MLLLCPATQRTNAPFTPRVDKARHQQRASHRAVFSLNASAHAGAFLHRAGPKPFSVARSSKGNYPVYSEMRNNNRRSTVLRKYSGDVKALIKELEAVTGRTVIQRNGCLDVLGNHNAIITKWLYKCGF
eukprot:1211293-Pleurochrysis_carterae.AAC.1